MAISLNRDAAFWNAIAEHPSVAPHVFQFDRRAILTNHAVMPVANEHGGFLFDNVDHRGFVYQAHAMFKPEGRGRGAWKLMVAALEELFASDARIIYVPEVIGKSMSHSPVTCGFELAGDPVSTDLGEVRIWFLTKARWLESEARKRMLQNV